MFCNYCRASNPNDALYCSACGRTIKPPLENKNEKQEAKSPATELPFTSSPPVTQPKKQESSGAIANPFEDGNSSENLTKAIPLIPAGVPQSPGQESPSWAYEKMSDEELDQLREAYQKLRVPIHPSLQSEFERRARKDKVRETKQAQLSNFGVQKSAESNPHAISNPNLGQSQSETTSHTIPQTNLDSSSATSKFETSLVLPVYATMGQRFTAYFADLILVYFIVIAVYFLSAAFHLPLSASEGESQLVTFIALFVYMTIAQSAYHTTIGKYVHGLEVCSERSNRKYPAFWRILVRETVGRLVSSFFWGAGYWFAIKKPKKQAWSDELAGTVVTTSPTNRVLVRALTAFVFVAFVLDVGIIGYGLYKGEKDKQYAAFTQEIGSVTKDVIASRQAVDQRVNETRPVNDWADFVLWQDQMKSLKQDLDRYEKQIDRMQGLIQRGITEDLAASATERNQFVKLRQIYDIRRAQAEKLRQESDLVINCDGKQASMVSLRTDLELLDSDIQGLEHQASQLMAEIGIK